MTQAEVERMDKRSAAIHEAGHLTVALAADAAARAWLHKTDEADTLANRTWCGTCQLLHGGLMTPTIAVAGVVAQTLDDVPDADADMIDEWIDTEVVIGLSETDLAHIPSPEARYKAIEEALAILRAHEAFHAWAVEQLIEHETITDFEAAVRFQTGKEVA